MFPLIRRQYPVCIIVNINAFPAFQQFFSVFIGYGKLAHQALNIAQYKTQGVL